MVDRVTSMLFVVLVMSVIAPAQAKKTYDVVDRRMPCGQFMGRMDVLLSEWKHNPSDRIAVVYYGQRYRKETRPEGNGDPAFTVLSFPHPDDGKNYAKAIPQYLLARQKTAWPGQDDLYASLSKNIVLIDGGFRENLEMEIWIVPVGMEMPDPMPTVSKENISFRKNRPYPTPNYFECYSGSN